MSLLFDNSFPAVYLPSSNQYYTGANGGYTWECWFYLTQPFGTNMRPLISATDVVIYEDLYLGFGWQGGLFNLPVTSLVFKVDGPGSAVPTGPGCNYTPPGGFLLNTWYHTAGVMDYTNQLATLYVNGLPVDTKTITSPPITRVIPTELSSNWSGTPLPLYGNMDEVRMWTRPLAAAEIFANYNQCLSGNESNLFVYYNCNQPGGGVVDDATPNNNNGLPATTLVNFQLGIQAPVSGTACSIPASTVTIIASDTLICPGETVTLTASGGIPGWSYTWTPLALNNFTALTNTTTVTPSVTSSYTVVGSSGYCWPAFRYDSIRIYVSPSIIAAPLDPVICSGESTTLTASGGVTYTWSTAATTNSIVVSPPVSTAYTVSGTSNLGCISQATMMVTVVPPATMQAFTNSPLICSGSTATLIAAGASTYTWSTGANTSIIFVNPTTNTTYSVYGGACPLNPGIVSISVTPNPTVSAFALNAVICSGSSNTLMASGANSYTWVNATPSTASSVVVNPPVTTSFTVYGAVNSCTGQAIITTSVAPQTMPAVSGAIVCYGSSATLNASGGDTYLWNGPQGYSANTASAFIPLISSATAGIYSVTVSTGGLCPATATVEVMGFPYVLPVASISVSPKTCINSVVELQGSGGVNYLWQGPMSFSSAAQTASFVANANMSGVYTLSVKNASNCAGSGTVLVNVLPLPTATLVSGGNFHCIPFCTSFSLDIPPGASSLISVSYESPSLFGPDASARYCFQQAGSHIVTSRFVDNNGCANSASFVLTAYEKPVANFEFTPLAPVEGPDPVKFVNTSLGSGQQQWNWFFTENGGGTSHAPNTSHVYENAGIYPVALVVINNWGCADTIIKVVKVENDFAIYVPNAFTPNEDGLNDTFQPKGIGITNYLLEIFDRWGEKLFESRDFLKGWDGNYKNQLCKADIYAWRMTLQAADGRSKKHAGHVSLVR